MRQNRQEIKGVDRWIYVSIPYTGHEAEMPERCRVAHARYDTVGIKVWTPRDVITDSSTPYEMCMGKCIEREMQCDEVIFADGWADSKGCSLEMQVCQIYGIPYRSDVKI